MEDEEVNIVNEISYGNELEVPITTYEVAQNIHTVLCVLTFFIMAFCMFNFLRNTLSKRK